MFEKKVGCGFSCEAKGCPDAVKRVSEVVKKPEGATGVMGLCGLAGGAVCCFFKASLATALCGFGATCATASVSLLTYNKCRADQEPGAAAKEAGSGTGGSGGQYESLPEQ